MVTIHLGSVLRTSAPQLDLGQFAEYSGTLPELLERLASAGGPALRDRLLENGTPRRYLNVFIDGRDARFLEPPVRIGPGTVVDLLPAVAGG
jgi:molybdopterin converting factor small subunit